MGRSQKGSRYEREVCTSLSHWWSNGRDSDLFWRSSGSGARAKSRSRRNKKTRGQHGDVVSTDPSTKPFIDVFTLELKRGYNAHTFQDLLDRSDGHAMQQWEDWIAQVEESWASAGSLTWAIVVRRDRREPLIAFPRTFIDIAKACIPIPTPHRLASLRYTHRRGHSVRQLYIQPFEEWLAQWTPDMVRAIARSN
jgi:hypothetical protein